jgi:hypothetical protein
LAIFKPKLLTSICNQIVFFVACVVTIYLASMLDNVTIGCHLFCQEIVPMTNMKIYLVVDLQVTTSPTQSTSHQFTRFRFCKLLFFYMFPLNSIPKVFVPCKYWRIFLITPQWSALGKDIN